MTHNHRQILKPACMILTALLCFAVLTVSHAQTTNTEHLAEKALAATVYLEMMDSSGETVSIGSGFFVQNDLIATNYHVIEGAARGTAKLVGTYTKYTIAGVTATDKSNDLALLKVSAYGMTPLPLGDSDRVKVGTQVYVAGNPKGLEGTFSDGIISSKRGGYGDARLQMTAPISAGSSGGPVLNTRGEVIGVSFKSLVTGQNLNFAIPSNYLKTLLARSKTARPLSSVNQTVSAETYFIRGNVLLDLDDYGGALEAYNSTIRLKPDYAYAYHNRGVAKKLLGRYQAAIADYDTAIRLKPDDADAYHNRGNAKDELGRYQAAIADYDTAIRLKPDDADAYYNRGLVKALLNRRWEAKQDLRTALRLVEKAGDASLKARIEKDLRSLE